MYWDGFCAFLPDISGLWGGGGAQTLQESANLMGEGGGGVFFFWRYSTVY